MRIIKIIDQHKLRIKQRRINGCFKPKIHSLQYQINEHIP